MVRTQVYLSEEQHRALRQAARREGISMTALLRRLVERELLGKFKRQDYAKDAIMALANLGRSDRSDISQNHDEALAEAFRDGTLR
ncbi:MAG: ribbon-helix-helix protein, CopG family [Geminicoccaceae bacterium]